MLTYYFSKYGLPILMQSDQGSNFMARFFNYYQKPDFVNFVNFLESKILNFQ